MSEPEDDGHWTARLEKAVEAVRAWEARTGELPTVPAGSPLALDDAEYPTYPVSTVVWWSLTSAIDHLGLGADLITSSDGLKLRPQAFYSVTRGALLGAAQAVWILGHRDRKTRVVRSLQVVADERKAYLAYMRGYANDRRIARDTSAEFAVGLSATIARVEESERDVRRKMGALGSSALFDATRMLTDVGESIPSDDLWLRRAYMHEWRMGSAATHARMWPLHVRQTERFPNLDGTTTVRVTGTLKELGQAFAAPTMLVSEAWRLWEQRTATTARPQAPAGR